MKIIHYTAYLDGGTQRFDFADGERVMDVLDLMQRALDKTNDPDAIFALDRGITEIERLREVVMLLVAYDEHDEEI